MKKANKRGKGGSYFQESPDSARVLVSGTDQTPDPEKPTSSKQSEKKPSTQSTEKGAE